MHNSSLLLMLLGLALTGVGLALSRRTGDPPAVAHAQVPHAAGMPALELSPIGAPSAARSIRTASPTPDVQPRDEVERTTAGRITGQILVGAGVPSDFLVLVAIPAATESARYQGMIRGDGSFEIPGLPAGEYHVSLDVAREEGVLHRFGAVTVREGCESPVPPFDARGRVRVATLDAVGPDGLPPPRGFVRRRAPDAEGFESRIEPLTGGRARIVTRHPYLDLRVEASGHRPVVLEGVRGDHAIVLERASKMRIVLEDGLPPLDPGEYVGVVIGIHGAGKSYDGIVLFDELGVAEPNVAEPGRYDVRVLVWRQHERGLASLIAEHVEAVVDFLPGGEGEIYPLHLSEATLAAIGMN